MFVTMVVFLVAGLWHGPSWMFVIFGALHGLGLIVNHSFNKFFLLNLNKLFCRFLTFNYVSFTLIFFRAQDLESAFSIIKAMTNITNFNYVINFDIPTISLIAFAFAFVICFMFQNTHYIITQLRK